MTRRSRRTNHPSNRETTSQVKYKTAAYCRLSHTSEESESIQNQMEYVEQYISGQPDMELTARFCDDAETGTNYDRTGFLDMMAAVQTGKINCIVVKDLSRLGRNFLETGELMEITLPTMGVRLIAINDLYDSEKSLSVNDALRFELQNLANEHYSKDISMKTSSALATMRENGCFIGNHAPYGYQKAETNQHTLVIDAPAAEIVRNIYKLRVEGLSYGTIARRLTAEGIASPSLYQTMNTIQIPSMIANSHPWNVPTVKKILTNRMYLGHMVQGGRSAEEVEVTVMNTHEAIINASIFEKVQSVISEKRSVYFESHGKYDSLKETENILKGYVYCAACGGRLTRRKEVYADGGKAQYIYVCARHEAHGNGICSNKARTHEKGMLENVLKQLQQHISGVLEATVLSASKDFQAQREVLLKRTFQLEEEIRTVTVDKCTIFEAYVNGESSAEAFKTRLTELDHGQKTLEKERCIFRSEISKLEAKETADTIRRKRLLPFQNMKTLSTDVLKAIVYRIVVSDCGMVTVKYNG